MPGHLLRGLARALVEAVLRGGRGACIAFAEGSDHFLDLFSESAGRALVSVARGQEKAFTALCDEHGLPWAALGVVDAASKGLEVRGQFTISLDELGAATTATLPRLLNPPAAHPDADAEPNTEPDAEA